MSGAYKIRATAVLLLAVLLASCASRRARETPPAAPAPQPPAVQQGAGREFQVDPAASLLTIRVYRGGALARAGHNHLIASHSLTGVVRVPEDPMRATFDVHLPVNELMVDEEDLRAREGPDFPPGVPEDAKEGTKRNMIGASLLEAERYPEIVLQSEAIQRGADGLEAQVRVIVRDRASSVIVPVKYEIRGAELQVQGELPIKQTDLGLTPFSLFGGALRVLDEMKIRFSIVARAP
jgi:polyisoprenoid-binding protein YceI